MRLVKEFCFDLYSMPSNALLNNVYEYVLKKHRFKIDGNNNVFYK